MRAAIAVLALLVVSGGVPGAVTRAVTRAALAQPPERAAPDAGAGPARKPDPDEGFTVAIGGDLSLGRGVRERAARDGWAAVLAPLREALAGADASLANLESPLGDCLPGGSVPPPRLCGDPEAAGPLAQAGIGAVTVANNHALDAGEAGLRDTGERLRARGVVVLGTADARTGQPAVERLGPLHVLAANLTRPAGSPGHDLPLPGAADVAAAVRAFRAREPREPLLVLLHAGREMDPDPSGLALSYARAAVDAGASAVVFHGAHTRRPFKVVSGVPVHLGLGNLLSDQRDEGARRGDVVVLRFRPGRPAELSDVRCVDSATGSLCPRAADGPPPAWSERLRAAAATPDSWRAYRDEIRTRILVASGLLPPFERPPVRANSFGRVARDGYTVENVQLETWPGFFLPANLYRPAGAGAGKRSPAVLSLLGHWKQGRFTDDDATSEPGRAITLARLGFVVLAPDIVGFGDLATMPHALPDADAEAARPWGLGLFSLQLWNALRALDYLAALPDVDATRIGATGASGGATQSFVLAAVDDRVAAVAPVSMVSAGFQGGCACENPPLLRIGLANAEIAAAAAPRPLLLVSATGDWTKDAPREVGEPLARVYAALGASERFRSAQVDAPHNYNRASRETVYAWMQRWLQGGPAVDRVTEPPFKVEPRAALSAITPAHALPPGALDARGLLESMRQAAEARVPPAPPPGDGADLARFREAMGPALRNLFALPPAAAAATTPPPARGRAAILVVATEAGEAAALARALRGRKSPLVTTAVLGDHPLEEPAIGIAKHQALFPDTYYRLALAWQVRDALEAVEALAARPDVAEVRVVGVGAAGPAALLARALARSPKLGRTVVDLRVSGLLGADAFPGLRRLGGLATAAALVTPAPVTIGAKEAWDAKRVAGLLAR